MREVLNRVNAIVVIVAACRHEKLIVKPHRKLKNEPCLSEEVGETVMVLRRSHPLRSSLKRRQYASS
jgi:hypothetical protein